MVYPVYESNEKFENWMDLLMRISYIMSVLKTLIDLCAIRQKINIKIPFASIVYNVLVMKDSWYKIKKLVWK